MNDATDYVHTHVINYEPTYLVLSDLVTRYQANDYNDMAELRDELAESVDQHWRAMGLTANSVRGDVDYAAMIEFEAGDR